MDTHKIVDRLEQKKEFENAKTELIKLAKEDIHRFILNCEAKGFKIGMKVGFMFGLLVGLIIYLIIK